jgi:hypothetical protein
MSLGLLPLHMGEFSQTGNYSGLQHEASLGGNIPHFTHLKLNALFFFILLLF